MEKTRKKVTREPDVILRERRKQLALNNAQAKFPQSLVAMVAGIEPGRINKVRNYHHSRNILTLWLFPFALSSFRAFVIVFLYADDSKKGWISPALLRVLCKTQ